jgi:hypothetical protein
MGSGFLQSYEQNINPINRNLSTAVKLNHINCNPGIALKLNHINRNVSRAVKLNHSTVIRVQQ